MHSRLIFLHRLRRLNLRVYLSKADLPDSRGSWARRKPGSRGRFVAEVCGGRVEKSAEVTTQSPVLKLTQVGEESILRRSRELRLRN
jgi:hypothetical protein